MEPITMGFILILGIALGEENKKQDEYITELHSEIMELEGWKYRMSGELADLAGKENMNNASQQDQIDTLVKKVLSE
jgi:hypothetical protein